MALALPTAADIRARSRIDFTTLGYPVEDPDDDFQRIVDSAVAYIAQTTCRVPLTDTPDALAPLAEDAVRMRVEQVVYQGQEGSVETAADDRIKSFSAGSYSETRSDLLKGAERALNSWSALAELLWALMTDECKERWVADLGGEPEPAVEIAEVNFKGGGLL